MASAKKPKILIVAARFNDMITKCLLAGAEEKLKDAGYAAGDYDIQWVPGCFEIPVIASLGAKSKKYACVIALGAVIRGETPHFDVVARESARGLMDVSLQYGLPVINGILTTDTVEQALNRSGIKHGNKGQSAAEAALSMLNIVQRL